MTLEKSYKKPTRAYANHSGHVRKIRREFALSTTYYEMSESTYKHKKRYVDNLEDRSKHTCLIHGSAHSSDE